MAAILLTAVVAGGLAFVRAVRIAAEREVNLHAPLFSISLVEKFVVEHGRWPRSWEELEALSVPSDPPAPLQGERTVHRIGGQHGFDWPAAAPMIRRRVFIDFEADPASLAAEDPMAFTAIKPIGPSYPYHHYGYVELLQATIRKVAEKRAVAPR